MALPQIVDEVPPLLRSLASSRALWSTKGEERYVTNWTEYLKRSSGVAQLTSTEFDVVIVGGGESLYDIEPSGSGTVLKPIQELRVAFLHLVSPRTRPSVCSCWNPEKGLLSTSLPASLPR